MAQLSETAIKEFKALFKARYHQEISDKEAVELAGNLLNLYSAVYSKPTGHSEDAENGSD